MALAAYTAGETLKQIVDDCVALANRPDLAFDPTTKAEPIDGVIKNALAYRWLLDIIRNLYLEHDWPFAIVARTVNQISPQCLQLPDDFWRVAYTDPLYVLKAGVRRSAPVQGTRPQFFNNPDLINPSHTGVPAEFYISRPDALIYLSPPPNEAFAYELHYFRLIPELTGKNEVPQFPHRDYLRQALLVRCYEHESDTRAMKASLDLVEIWKKIRSSVYDLRENPEQSPGTMLDPNFFKNVSYDD